MRYARNLAEGNGLVWLAGGERVEGYTNPLWVLVMTLPHLLHIKSTQTSLFIQIIAAFLMTTAVYYTGKIASFLNKDSSSVGIIAMLMTMFYLPLLTWTLGGMEVSLIVLLILLSLWLTIKNHSKGTFSAMQLILPGIAILARLDAIIVFFLITTFLFIYQREQRKKIILTAVIVLILALVPQSIFRLVYYGDILPNTYYLKMTGVPLLLRISKGLLIFLKFALFMNPIIFLMPFAYAIIKKGKYENLLLALIVFQMSYSIYVGGDAWEWWGGANRFICIVMPLFFILLALSLDKIIKTLFDYFSNLNSKIQKFKKITYSVVLLSVIISLNSIYGIHANLELIFVEKPFSVEYNQSQYEAGKFFEKIIKGKDAVVAVTAAGTLPYHFDYNYHDMLGKNDTYIAKTQAHFPSGLAKFTAFFPGHNKWDYDYTINKIKPDVFVNLWRQPEEAIELFNNNYISYEIPNHKFYFRKDSPFIDYSKLNK